MQKVTRRRALAASGAVVLIPLVAGCGKVAEPPGLYFADLDRAPRWIHNTIGVPAWSPDSETVAWGDEDGLRTWNRSTGDVLLVAAMPVVGRPAWSPDGLSVVFLDPGAKVLQRLDLASGATKPLAALYQGKPGSSGAPIVSRGGPAWSPDGSFVAFICWDGQGDELCVVDSDGKARQQVTTLGSPDSGQRVAARSSVTSMAWSPDSRELAVAVQAEQQGATSGVFRVDLQARSGKRLTRITANAPVIWEAATGELIFSARVEGRSDVYRMPAVGGQPRSITSFLSEGAREPGLGGGGAITAVSGNRIAVLSPESDDVTYLEIPGLASSSPAFSAREQLAFVAAPRPIEGYP